MAKKKKKPAVAPGPAAAATTAAEDAPAEEPPEPIADTEASTARLTLEELQAIQAETLADDIKIDFEKMSNWTKEQATAYFESGGQDEPGVPASESPPVVLKEAAGQEAAGQGAAGQEAPPPAESPAPAAEEAMVNNDGSSRPTAPLGRKPRLVFLHGTAGNETIIRIQLAPLLRVLKDVVEVHFVVGQLSCSEDDPLYAEDVRFMKKWFGTKQELRAYARYGSDESGWRTYEAIDETLDAIEQQMRALPGPVDALVGFSQGANIATMLDARAALRVDGAPSPFRCVVLLSGAAPGWVTQKPELFAAPTPTPALVAASDDERQKERGPDVLANLYESAQQVLHKGPGHRPLPADRAECAAFVERIRDFILLHCPSASE